MFMACVAAVLAAPAGAQSQIFADVQLTGGVVGNFTITLEPVKAPVAVANFIGLATGRNAWIDPATGRLRNDPFYQGLTFHRVVANFVSQTGSRNGQGTDGPGYSFANEIDPSLSHATPYTVAMANSGGAYSNGSQFYITTGNATAAPTGLDGSYTIFGRVTSGAAVCDALNAVTTNATSVPLTPVTIASVNIYGPSYSSFNLQPNGLPKVVGGRPSLTRNGTATTLGYDRQPYSSYFGSNSTDLVSWTRFVNDVYFHGVAPTGDVDVTGQASGARAFFQYSRVDYSLARNPFIPASVANKTFTFPGLFGTQQVQMTINAAGTGGNYSYTFDGISSQGGNLTQVFYAVGNSTYSLRPAYAPYLFVQWDGTNPVQIAFDRLEYSSSSSGKHYGRSNVGGFSNLSGIFNSVP
ncbi:MAG: peptidylprolyl isomerase [Candidatus Methylacidiphilales bacterium]|nr:peptidylprolyl isomerase [Candidatus Methylacidiphilales bacterium]